MTECMNVAVYHNAILFVVESCLGSRVDLHGGSHRETVLLNFLKSPVEVSH